MRENALVRYKGIIASLRTASDYENVRSFVTSCYTISEDTCSRVSSTRLLTSHDLYFFHFKFYN